MSAEGCEAQAIRNGWRPTCYREWSNAVVFIDGVQVSDVAELSWTMGQICRDGSIRRTKQTQAAIQKLVDGVWIIPAEARVAFVVPAPFDQVVHITTGPDCVAEAHAELAALVDKP